MRRSRIPLFLILTVLCAGGWALPASAVQPRPPVGAASSGVAQDVALEISAQAGGKIKNFYASRGFWPLWAENGRIGPAADALIGHLESAALDGLNPQSYKIEALREAMVQARAGDPAAVARAELALSNAFIRYVRDMRRPPKVKIDYVESSLRPKRPRHEAVLRAAALPDSLKDYVANMGWMSQHYVRLRKLMDRADAMPKDRIARLRLNMERARALPGPWARHIVVDAASGRLWYYQAGKQQGMMRVVVGTPQTQTPMMAGMLNYAIFNPYWNVPTDLAQKNIAPKILSGRTLKSMGMEALSDWSEAAQPLDPQSIDWNAVAAGAQELRLRQLPGGGNSMGKVKFLFPNDDGIYLHDTPDKQLFAKKDRHFSNGCIRLEDAQRLSKWLVGKPKIAAKTPEQAVVLPAPVPVYLTYITATPTESGIGFLADVYGRDGGRSGRGG